MSNNNNVDHNHTTLQSNHQTEATPPTTAIDDSSSIIVNEEGNHHHHHHNNNGLFYDSDPLPLKHFYNNPDYSDVIIECVGTNDTNHEEFYASRLLVAAWAPPLAKLLSGPFLEGGNQSSVDGKCFKRITLKDIDPHIFRIILQFLYQCDDPGLTHQSICEMIRVVDQFCIERLLYYCEGYLIHQLNQLETRIYWVDSSSGRTTSLDDDIAAINSSSLMMRRRIERSPNIQNDSSGVLEGQNDTIVVSKSNEREELLHLLLEGFHLSSEIPSLSRLRSSCLNLIASSGALSFMIHQEMCEPPPSMTEQPERPIILRLPMCVLKELLEMDSLQVPEELLVLSVCRIIDIHAKNLSYCYIRDHFNDQSSSIGDNELPIDERKAFNDVDSQHQQQQQQPHYDDAPSPTLTSSTATPSTATPQTPASSSTLPEFLVASTPLLKEGSTSTTSLDLSSMKDVQVNRRKRGRPPSSCFASNSRPLKRFCEPDNHLQSDAANTTTTNSSDLPSYDDDHQDVLGSSSSRQLLPVNINDISFIQLCHLLNLPPQFFISSLSHAHLTIEKLKATLEFIALLLLYRQLESKLRYVLIAPDRLVDLNIQFANPDLINRAILWHLTGVRTERLSCFLDDDGDSDKDSDVDRNVRLQQLRKRLLKPKKSASLRKLRQATFRLYSLCGYSVTYQEQSTKPRHTLLKWKVNSNRLELRGSQIIVRGETPPAPAALVDWVTSTATTSFSRGLHELFFRLDCSAFNNIILGVTSAIIKDDDQLNTCCHSNGHSLSLVLYHGNERNGPNANRLFVKVDEPAEGDIIYMRLDLRGSQGRLQFFAIRRKHYSLYPATLPMNTTSMNHHLTHHHPNNHTTSHNSHIDISSNVASSSPPLHSASTIIASSASTTEETNNDNHDIMHQQSTTTLTSPTIISRSGGIRSPTSSSSPTSRNSMRMRILRRRRRLFEQPLWHRRRLYDDERSIDDNDGEDDDDDDDDEHPELNQYDNSDDPMVFVRTPILSDHHRASQRSGQWCGNVLLGQNVAANQHSIMDDDYFYEIWSLGRFNNVPIDNKYRCFDENQSRVMSAGDVSNTAQQSSSSSHTPCTYRPFIDLRDLHDSISLLPYQHQIAKYIPF